MLPLLFLLASQPIVLDVEATDACYAPDALREAVERRAGPGSVVVEGARVARVFRPDADEVIVQLVVDDVVRGTRTLGARDCNALLPALTLTLALLVDPLLPLTPVVEEPVAPPPPPPAPAPAPAPVVEETLKRRKKKQELPLHVQVHGGAGVGAGLAPGVGFSSLLRLQLGAERLGVGLGARLDLPSVVIVDGTHRIEAAAAAAVVDVCYVDSFWSASVHGCAVGEAGALRAVGIGYTAPEPIVAQVMTAGAAVGVVVPVLGDVGVFTRMSLTTPVLRALLRDGVGTTVWESPALSGQWLIGIGTT